MSAQHTPCGHLAITTCRLCEGPQTPPDWVAPESVQHTPGLDDLAFLDSSAEGLDLLIAEHRAIFRMRVSDRLKATKVEAMREWVGGTMRDRYSAARAVANAYIAKATGSPATIGG